MLSTFSLSTPQPASSRLETLDSLRGLAAFVVFLGHAFLSLWNGTHVPPWWLSFTPLRIFTNGYVSVILFFVLSGYVLSIPFLQGGAQPYLPFLVKRLCRIYLPFAAAIFLAVLLFINSGVLPPDIGSEWLHKEWDGQTLTFATLSAHLLMIGTSHDMWLDGVIWSLVHELRISLLFPLLVLLCRRTSLATMLAVTLYIAAAGASMATKQDWSLITTGNFGGTFLITLRFVPIFMLGILLSKHNEAIAGWLRRRSPIALAAMLAATLLVLCLPTQITNQKFLAALGGQAGVLKYWAEILLALAAGFLIVCARNVEWMAAGLRRAPIRWMGKISYSFYLIHLPVLFFLARFLLDKIPFPLFVVSAAGASLTAAWLFHTAVEQPCMALGKKLASRLRPRARTIA